MSGEGSLTGEKQSVQSTISHHTRVKTYQIWQIGVLLVKRHIKTVQLTIQLQETNSNLTTEVGCLLL